MGNSNYLLPGTVSSAPASLHAGELKIPLFSTNLIAETSQLLVQRAELVYGDSMFSHTSSFPTGSQKSLEQQLINDLLRGYNKDAHPIPEQNKTSYAVTFGLELVQLVNVVSKLVKNIIRRNLSNHC